MELNEKLISLRKQNKLTQAQVAETLDVSRQAISNWETGAVLPSTDNLKSAQPSLPGPGGPSIKW